MVFTVRFLLEASHGIVVQGLLIAGCCRITMGSLNILSIHVPREVMGMAYRFFTPIPQPAAENAVAVPLQPHAILADLRHHVGGYDWWSLIKSHKYSEAPGRTTKSTRIRRGVLRNYLERQVSSIVGLHLLP